MFFDTDSIFFIIQPMPLSTAYSLQKTPRHLNINGYRIKILYKLVFIDNILCYYRQTRVVKKITPHTLFTEYTTKNIIIFLNDTTNIL